MLHCAYEAVKKSIQAYVTRAGVLLLRFSYRFRLIRNEEIIAEFRRGLGKGKANGRKIREEGVEQVFVDAAHAIGSVDINVKEIGADFYKASLGFDVHHPVVSHEYGNGLPIESAWVGTRDYSSQLVVPAALEFVNRFEDGIHGIMKRNHEEVVKMGKMLAESWRTNLGSPPEMCAGMIMVGLPSRLRVSSEDDASRLRSHLRECHGVEVPIHYQGLRDGEEGLVVNIGAALIK
ncbi:epimerase-related family protein [Populus alba x Populus x berolinensis]|uniref:Epimerase-related family protein n=1 Tax=Populus alba x Populus x berolinensis TaxID=444605 RepID=A0AAD6LT61_9ROSI|nr:epimerase-related family protein [Populus alba x Populus x berolinensis]